MNRLTPYFALTDRQPQSYQGDLLHLGKANCPVKSTYTHGYECPCDACQNCEPIERIEFVGMVALEPWQLGDTWVTKLVDMEDGYAVFTGKRGDKATTVYAAAVHAMRMDGETMPRPGGQQEPCKYRCNICGGVVEYDGTPPVAGNWGGRK